MAVSDPLIVPVQVCERQLIEGLKRGAVNE